MHVLIFLKKSINTGYVLVCQYVILDSYIYFSRTTNVCIFAMKKTFINLRGYIQYNTIRSMHTTSEQMQGGTNKSAYQTCSVCFSPLSCLLAHRGSGLVSPQVIKVCELCQSALCTLRQTSWLPVCV